MSSATRQFRIGVAFALINTVSLGILGLIDKIGASQGGINPFIFSTQSVLFGLLFVTLFAFIHRRGAFIEDLKKTSTTSWKLIFLVGITASGLFVMLRFLGLTESTGTFASLSQVTTTAITAILAFFFLKEKLSGKFWLLFVIIILATYFVSVGRFTLTNLELGDTYILLGTLFLATSNIFAKLVSNTTHPLVLSVGRFFFGGIFLLLISIIFFNNGTDLQEITVWSVISGFFWSVNNTAFNFAIQKIGVTLLTSILMLGPVITMILEYLILKQIFNPVQIVAAFVIITCGIFMIRAKNKSA